MQQILTCQNCNKEIESKCIACLEKELADWRPSKSIEFSEKVAEFKDKIETETPCKKCGKHIDICSECFHTYIYNWLQEEDQLLAEEFMAFFNIHN